jgi:hypothetical protein
LCLLLDVHVEHDRRVLASDWPLEPASRRVRLSNPNTCWPRAMSLDPVISELYQAGIDCGLESFQGRGVTAWIVNERNRRVEKEFSADDLHAIAEWLRLEATQELAKRNGQTPGASAHSMLAELANSQRKDAKRVSYFDRTARRDVALRNEADGTTR